MENRKRATELALKKLRERLSRGEKPEDLLENTQFTPEELDRFLDRLEQRLADPGTDQSPDSQAQRRQFETLLRGIDYQSSGERRDGGDQERDAAQGFGSSNRPVPPEYRLEGESFQRRLSEQGSKK
ncbi:hypothetical protein KOR42_46320 [Thalassoglobus neptunius]|uniref:Uncharacterized protein n=1 Tax=Thalassoglobus neptunius TaxID=1938619 RepID=A0A5C5VW38_9PLAN|nr:hypothetical protein [Thalassoglobus neptunius]TWT42828.1 hypothetical protein KOR42_46320 [Thalassoglobus neptunius]